MSREERYFEKRMEEIREGERGGSPEDREALLQMGKGLRRNPGDRGDERRWDVLMRATVMAEEVGGIHRIVEDTQAVDDIVHWIDDAFAQPDGCRLRQTTTSWDSWESYRSALITAATVLNREEKPETVRSVSLKKPKAIQGRSSDKDLPGPEVVERRMEACSNPHERAVIGLSFATGLRPKAALWKLRWGDVDLRGARVIVHVHQDKVDHATPREVEVFWDPAKEAIRTWLDYHPTKNPDNPLWMTRNTNGRMTYRRFGDIFREAAEDSQTTHLASTPKKYQRANRDWLKDEIGLDREVIAGRQGRRPDSDHEIRYTAQRSADRQAELFRDATGQTLDGETETIEELLQEADDQVLGQALRLVFEHHASEGDLRDLVDAADTERARKKMTEHNWRVINQIEGPAANG